MGSVWSKEGGVELCGRDDFCELILFDEILDKAGEISIRANDDGPVVFFVFDGCSVEDKLRINVALHGADAVFGVGDRGFENNDVAVGLEVAKICAQNPSRERGIFCGLLSLLI